MWSSVQQSLSSSHSRWILHRNESPCSGGKPEDRRSIRRLSRANSMSQFVTKRKGWFTLFLVCYTSLKNDTFFMQTHECNIHVKCSRCVKFKCLKWWANKVAVCHIAGLRWWIRFFFYSNPLKPETLNNQRNIFFLKVKHLLNLLTIKKETSFNSYFVCYILYIFVCVIYLHFSRGKTHGWFRSFKKNFQKFVCVKYDKLGIKGVKPSNWATKQFIHKIPRSCPFWFIV